jgi:NDP-hexose-3-ketoreductase
MLAIIGFGEHVIRNIIPTLNELEFVNIKYILVRQPEKYSKKNPCYNFISDFNTIIDDIEVTRIYIATPIASHIDYVEKAILAGKHVLCEKTLSNNFSETKKLVDLAITENVNLQEVVIYEHHHQIDEVRRIIAERKAKNLKKICISFQIPHLDKSNIRYNKLQGGGALLDVGFYPLSYLNSLFSLPKEIYSLVYSEDEYEVDLTGSALLDYVDFYAIAEWGIGRVYRNEVSLEFEKETIIVERPISKPSNLETKIVSTSICGNKTKIMVKADDHFKNLFTYFYSFNEANFAELDGIVSRAELINRVQVNK